jgi:hypothetical protein
MVIEIRGFVLPPLLEKFLNEGIWTSKRSITVPQTMLSSIGIDLEVTVRLYGLEGLKWDNTYFDNMNDEDFEFLRPMNAWVSSKRTGKPITDTSKLDIDYAVCIASEISDDVIYLDYRVDETNPRVLVMDWKNRVWRILVPDFDTFAKAVGLVD